MNNTTDRPLAKLIQNMVTIHALSPDKMEAFFSYLTQHVAENGEEGVALFLPLTKQQSLSAKDWKSKFDGLYKAPGEPGWRKIWVALTQDNTIVGHVDIRSNDQLNAEHRVVLGMGVDSNFRRFKIGYTLMEFIIKHCKNASEISWLDLEVLETNIPARRLYEKMGFEQVSVIKDMFRIDKISYNYIGMTLHVENLHV
jgi:ribosomal protein S18 acetylase RimI-like enzyme